MRRITSVLFGGMAIATGAYWLMKYLQPRHSPLAYNGTVAVITDATSPVGRALSLSLAKRGARSVSYTHLTLPTILRV